MHRACFIERNRAALLRVVVALVYMTGLDAGGAETIPRRVWRRVIVLLRPAESCVRRLIVVAAHAIPVTIREPRPAKPNYVPWWTVKTKAATPDRTAKKPVPPDAPLIIVANGPREHRQKTVSARAFRQRFGLACWGPLPQPTGSNGRIPAFPLFDPLKRFDFGTARNAAWLADGWPLPLPDDDDIDAAPLCRRVVALKAALDDIEAQARRMARWQARRGSLFASLSAGQRLAAYDRDGQRLAAYESENTLLRGATIRFRRVSPLRPGYPPGRRRHAASEIDRILRDCHAMARHVEAMDTS